MTDRAKPSGPLWAVPLLDGGELFPSVLSETDYVSGVSRRCRLIPGHGKVVPVELVEAIDLAFDGSNAHSDQWITNVRAAIKAALGGAM